MGRSWGTVTCQNVWKLLAPSMRDASMVERSMVCSPARKNSML